MLNAGESLRWRVPVEGLRKTVLWIQEMAYQCRPLDGGMKLDLGRPAVRS